MSIHGQTIIQWLEQFAPKALAEDWDKVGLQIGSLQQQVTNVLITLDVTDEVVEEAIQQNVQLIIAHHPLIFRPLQHLRTDLPNGKLLAKLVKHDIAVYASHTNLDITEGGVNDWLAERLGLEQTEILSVTGAESLKKLVVFVPHTHESQVREAIGNAGAGVIGAYSHTSFRASGIGSFIPLEGAKPFIGQQGVVEEVEEYRVETIFPASLEKKVIQAMLKAHPYEEVAYDIYPLDQKGKAYGLGRIGQMANQLTLRELAEVVKQCFQLSDCKVVGKLDNTISKVAILGGSGSKYIQAAIFRGADVLITGDIDYHAAHDALMHGINLIDAGHHIEKVMMEGVQRVLQQAAEKQKARVNILTATCSTNPFTTI